MRVLVDTSAWVDFLNGHPSPAQNALRELLLGNDDVCTCGVVVAEVLQGLRRDKSFAEVQRLFRKLTFLEPLGIDAYERAADVYRSLRAKGISVRSTIDCVIAVIAETSGCYVLANDRDITRILESGLVKAGRWPT